MTRGGSSSFTPALAHELMIASGLVTAILLALVAAVVAVRISRGQSRRRRGCQAIPQDSPRTESPPPAQGGAGPTAAPPPAASAPNGKKRKMHCFLLVGADYYQKTTKLSPSLVTSVAALHAALQDLFAEELFAAELGRGGRPLRVSGMEVQFLHPESGVPVLVDVRTPLAPVLASSALLLSDRPIAELVSQGHSSSEHLHARSTSTRRPRGPKRLGKAAGGGKSLGHRERRMLTSTAGENDEEEEEAVEAEEPAGEASGAEATAAAATRVKRAAKMLGMHPDAAAADDVECGGSVACSSVVSGASRREPVVAVPSAFFERPAADAFFHPARASVESI